MLSSDASISVWSESGSALADTGWGADCTLDAWGWGGKQRWSASGADGYGNGWDHWGDNDRGWWRWWWGNDAIDGSGDADGTFLDELGWAEAHSERAHGSSGALDSWFTWGAWESLRDQSSSNDWGRGDRDWWREGRLASDNGAVGNRGSASACSGDAGSSSDA